MAPSVPRVRVEGSQWQPVSALSRWALAGLWLLSAWPRRAAWLGEFRQCPVPRASRLGPSRPSSVSLRAARGEGGGDSGSLRVSGPVGWSSRTARLLLPAGVRSASGHRTRWLYCLKQGKGGASSSTVPLARREAGRPAVSDGTAKLEALPSRHVSWCPAAAAQAVLGPRVRPAPEEGGFAAAVPLHRCQGAGQHLKDLLGPLHVFRVAAGARPLAQLGATPCGECRQAQGQSGSRGAPGSWCPGLSWTHSALPRPAGAVVSPRDPEPGGTPWSSVRRSAAPRHGPRWRSRLRKASSTGSAWWGSGRVEVAPGSSGGGTTPA